MYVFEYTSKDHLGKFSNSEKEQNCDTKRASRRERIAIEPGNDNNKKRLNAKHSYNSLISMSFECERVW